MKFNFFIFNFFFRCLVVYSLFQFLMSQDLWVENESYNSVLPAGTVVQVAFAVDFTINSQKNSTKEVNANPLAQGVSGRLLSFLLGSLGTELGDAVANSNNEELQNLKQLSGNLAGTLGNFDPVARNYPIVIRREFTINGEPETILLTGTVSENSANQNQVIPAQQIANLSFTFNSLSDSFSITENDIENFDLSPSGITNQNNNLLQEGKRREIFVKYFNWILKDLFD